MAEPLEFDFFREQTPYACEAAFSSLVAAATKTSNPLISVSFDWLYC